MASANPRTMSLPYGECITEKALSLVSYIEEPLWCFVVSTAYCMPTDLASFASATGSHCCGSKVAADEWYCSGVTFWEWGRIPPPPTSGHEISSPCWLAWSQWMNMPKPAVSNQVCIGSTQYDARIRFYDS